MIFKKFSMLCSLSLWCAGGLMADFTYEQSSKITGGMMAGMMKVAGVFSKAAREPIVSTISVKGDRMVNQTRDSAQVIDLGRETITEINFKNKTYSSITFAQMTEALREASRKMQEARAKDGKKADLTFKASVKETGQSKQIQGMNARQMILVLDVEGADKQTGEAGAMQVVGDMWLAPSVAGYEEVRNFYTKLGQKLAWTPGGLGMMTANAQPGMVEGMSELYKQTAKLDGVPVMQVMRIGAKVEGQDLASVPSQTQGGQTQGGQTQADQPQPQTPSAGQVAGQAAGSTAANAAASRLGRSGAIGGALGGFGGFGRKKKEEAQQPPPPQQQEQSAPRAGQPGGLLIEMTTELTGLSSGAVDGSKFEVPAGFKQVQSETLKRMK